MKCWAALMGVLMLSAVAHGQIQRETKPPIDGFTIANEMAPKGMINAWVARGTKTENGKATKYAYVLYVPKSFPGPEPARLNATLMKYQLNARGKYERTKIRICLKENTPPIECESLTVYLERVGSPKADRCKEYELKFTQDKVTHYTLGWVRYKPAVTLIQQAVKEQRMHSAISILLYKKHFECITALCKGQAHMLHNCDEPPSDDVGEEEPLPSPVNPPVPPQEFDP